LALTVAGALCVVATRWQIGRALSGNALSWMYVFEWPAFAGIAGWMWWALLTLPERRPGPAAVEPVDSLVARRRAELSWDPASESEQLRAYNAFLAQLNAEHKRDSRR
jgi:hypothetical protein